MPRGVLNYPGTGALLEREDIIDRPGLLGKGRRKGWEYYAGPHLSKGIKDLGSLIPAAAEIFGPQADMKDLYDYSKRSAENVRQGKYLEGAGNFGLAAAALGMTALPGSVGGIQKALGTGPTADVGKQVKGILKKGAKEQLTAKQLEKLAVAPKDFQKAAKWMMPTELGKVLDSPRGVEQVSRLLEVLPSAKNMAATAKMGMPKLGWYRASTNALVDVFGPEDSRRFATLLAATSPQNSVEMNLMNTLNIWDNWVKAGRPTTAAAIKRVMGNSVAGSKGEASVLDAWVNNSVRALAASDPSKVVLSGPKVDSFYRNLVGDVMRVTNDAHMSNVSGISQDILRMSPSAGQLAKGDPGYSPAYAALSGNVRQGGAQAGMWPAEAQETIWSVGMPLNELQATLGMPARDILQKGLLTPETIRGTPDFSTLLNTGEYRDILKGAGYEDQSAKLKPHVWPETTPSLSIAEQNEVMKTAKRLEDLRALRGREKSARATGTSFNPSKATVYHTAEYVPGAGTGHAPGILNAPENARARMTGTMSSAMTDPQGLDIINKNIGLDPIQTRAAQGVFQPPAPAPLEYQPMRALGVEAPLVGGKNPRLKAADEQRLRTAATVRGGMTGQLGSPYSGLVRSKTGGDVYVPREGKLTPDEMKDFVSRYGTEDVAAADVGQGVNVLNFSDVPFKDFEPEQVGKVLGATAEPGLARNVTDPNMNYVDLSEEWLQAPGSRKVTQRMIDEIDKLSAKDIKSLDGREIRQAAGDIHKVYEGLAKKGEPLRGDLMNLLEIVRDKGLAGLRLALDNKEFLPSIAAIGLAPTVYQLAQQEGGTSSRPSGLLHRMEPAPSRSVDNGL